MDDALLAASLLAVDPGLGVRLRGPAGAARAQWIERLRCLLPAAAPMRRCPLSVSDEHLCGGLDLAATLRDGRRIETPGLLAEADGGVVLLQTAERIGPGIAARLACAIDTGTGRVGVVALDEGLDGESPPASLLDRLALSFTLDERAPMTAPAKGRAAIRSARRLLAQVTADDELVGALCAAALSFGIGSLRAPLLALRTARAACALRGATHVSDQDAAAAARLVLAPRAICLPESAAAPPPPEASEPDASQPDDAEAGRTEADLPGEAESGMDAGADQPDEGAGSITETVQNAVQAALPADLLSRLQPAVLSDRRMPARRGRPVGVRRGDPARGRLDLVATLRAALPWQTLRRMELDAPVLVQIRREDFRITRFAPRDRTTTIFAVDASGSAARTRLAEAKGCVELLLGECYVRRDQVALISFGGSRGELVLPPTASVVRARRCLSGLPGGGGTPLAAGLDAALLLAGRLRRQGGSAILVLLTDGRANVARDGTAGRARAESDALDSARRVRAAALPSLLVDISPRTQPATASFAAIMGARYLPLPQADATAMSRAVRAATAP